MKPPVRSLILCVGLAFAQVPSTFAQATTTPAASAPAAAEEMDEVDDYAVVQVSDPFEPVNRAIFKFNDHLYDYVLRPIAKGYKRAVPRLARQGISNFFDNIRFPIRFVNGTLQCKFKRAGLETGKFVVNTVAGVGGLIRVSDKVPALASIPVEDTGQTFGVWHIGKGPFVVLPVLGPGTIRDTVGGVGDYFLNPLNWNLRDNIEWYTWEVQAGVTTVDTVNMLPGLLSTYDALHKDAIDPYIAVRSAYVQHREAAVKQ